MKKSTSVIQCKKKKTFDNTEIQMRHLKMLSIRFTLVSGNFRVSKELFHSGRQL